MLGKKTFVKICANTNLEDALLAADLGADAVGFVFAPSLRRVTVEQVAAITRELPAKLERIGVFGEAEGDAIVTAVRRAGLSGVQLHGGYVPLLVQHLRGELGSKLRIIQTNHWRVGGQVPEAFSAELRRIEADKEIDAVLVDSRTTVADGGTGVTFDWQAARESMAPLGGKPLIVAGGLSEQNVATAIAVLKPWGVDVASGVEAVPGKKDPQRLKAFLLAALAAG